MEDTHETRRQPATDDGARGRAAREPGVSALFARKRQRLRGWSFTDVELDPGYYEKFVAQFIDTVDCQWARVVWYTVDGEFDAGLRALRQAGVSVDPTVHGLDVELDIGGSPALREWLLAFLLDMSIVELAERDRDTLRLSLSDGHFLLIGAFDDEWEALEERVPGARRRARPVPRVGWKLSSGRRAGDPVSDA